MEICYLILSCVFFMTYTYGNDTLVLYVVVRESQLFIVKRRGPLFLGRLSRFFFNSGLYNLRHISAFDPTREVNGCLLGGHGSLRNFLVFIFLIGEFSSRIPASFSAMFDTSLKHSSMWLFHTERSSSDTSVGLKCLSIIWQHIGESSPVTRE